MRHSRGGTDGQGRELLHRWTWGRGVRGGSGVSITVRKGVGAIGEAEPLAHVGQESRVGDHK